MPFAYFKIVGHKFALMVKGPTGAGSSSTLDRWGNAIVFLIFGPLILFFNSLVDTVYFLIHVYKMDLDKTEAKKVYSESDIRRKNIPIHRRTFEKMFKYFQTQND